MQKFLLVSEKSFFWLILFLVVFIPLYPKFPLFNIQGTFVAIRIEDLFIAVIIGLWILKIIIQKKVINILSDQINQSLLVFFFVGLVSLFSAIFLTHTVIPHLAFLHYLRRIELMLLIPLVVDILKTRKQLEIILIMGLIITFLVNSYAFGQKYLNFPVISTGNSEFSKGLILSLSPEARVSSTFAGHYDLAVFMIMVLALGSAVFFALKKIYLRSVTLLVLISSVVVLIMTAARLSFVSALLGIGSSLFLAGKKLLILIMIIMVIGIFAYPSQLRERFLATISVGIFNQGEKFVTTNQDQLRESQINIPTLLIQTSSTSGLRHNLTTNSAQISDIVPGEPTNLTDLSVYRSFGIRFNQEWPRAIRAFLKNPLLGTGYSSLGLATDNDFLRLLGEVGILGTLAFTLVLLGIIKNIWFSYQKINNKLDKFFLAGILAMIFAFISNGIFIDVFEASKIATLFWLFCGFGLAVSRFYENT